MSKDNTEAAVGVTGRSSEGRRARGSLLAALLALLPVHRPAFGQERTYRRAVGLVVAELIMLGRHTVTQGLLALGLGGSDWSAWYRLFSCERFDEAELTGCLFRETLKEVKPEALYVVGIDSTPIRRSSRKMPGTSWVRAAGTALFQRGLQRAQRFEHGAWLPPLQAGYTRAIPLRFLPAFPATAVAACAPAMQEWKAGLQFVCWVRQRLDQAGRLEQRLLVLADGAYDNVEFWRGLPGPAIAVVRTARNRILRSLPPVSQGRGRKRKYGEVAPKPADWLSEKEGWTTTAVPMRGRTIQMRYQVHGPYLRERVPDRPLWLIVVGGAAWMAGKRDPRRARRLPAFYLVSSPAPLSQAPALAALPLPVELILTWLWQRWELEVAHREMKSSFGIGDKQCWNQRSAVVAVQWSVWVYAVLLLAAYRTWGWFDGPAVPTRWWPGAQRWSFNTLWRAYRTEIWQLADSHPVWYASGDDWPKIDDWLRTLPNAITAFQRA